MDLPIIPWPKKRHEEEARSRTKKETLAFKRSVLKRNLNRSEKKKLMKKRGEKNKWNSIPVWIVFVCKSKNCLLKPHWFVTSIEYTWKLVQTHKMLATSFIRPIELHIFLRFSRDACKNSNALKLHKCTLFLGSIKPNKINTNFFVFVFLLSQND